MKRAPRPRLFVRARGLLVTLEALSLLDWQDLTKDMAWPILISSQTYRFVNEQYETEFAGSRLVKGRSESVAD